MHPVKSKCVVKTISIRKEDHEKIKKIAMKEKRSFSTLYLRPFPSAKN